MTNTRKHRPLSEDCDIVKSLKSQGHTYREISAILGCSYKRIKRVGELLSTIAKSQKPDAPKRQSKSPQKVDIRERIATDELTIPFSNWLGNGWIREAGEHQEVYETDATGEQILVGAKVDPGVLWPEDWDGTKSFDDIWISPKVPAQRSTLDRGYVLTSSQALTPVHGPFLLNLKALMKARGYETLEIGGFTYGKSLFSKNQKREVVDVAPWSSAISDIVTRDRRHISKTLQACFEMNMRPTKTNPLTGLFEYVRGKTSIFAHPKRAIESVPRPKFSESVTMWTTGACTVPNYIEQEAGLRALQDHQIGAVIVEIDVEGREFIRTLDADPETGNFHDLDLYVSAGAVYTLEEIIGLSDGAVGRPVMGVPCTHRRNMSPEFGRALWGYGGNPKDDISLIDLVQARAQTYNDIFDGASINHHEEKNPIALYERAALRHNKLEPELEEVAEFIKATSRSWCDSYVAYSNHDDFLARWLQKPSTEVAVENSKIWHQANFEWRCAIDEGSDFNPFEWVIRKISPDLKFSLVTADTPLEIYGVLYNFHGDKGPNGSKGSNPGFARMGLKVVKAHTHTICRRGGVSDIGNGLDAKKAKYASGPSSWGRAFSLGHSDGSVQMGLIVGDKYRA